VIKTFADKRTRDLFLTGQAARFPADVARRAARKLEYVDLAANLNDLKGHQATVFTRSTTIAKASTPLP
jgi:plasmid maintenance system killer protein